jgi:hypothetical protein
MNDRTRQGLIQSALGMEHGLGSDTSISGNVQRVGIYAEQEVLSRTALLLEEAMTHSKISEDIARRAEDVYETSLSLAKKN